MRCGLSSKFFDHLLLLLLKVRIRVTLLEYAVWHTVHSLRDVERDGTMSWVGSVVDKARMVYLWCCSDIAVDTGKCRVTQWPPIMWMPGWLKARSHRRDWTEMKRQFAVQSSVVSTTIDRLLWHLAHRVNLQQNSYWLTQLIYVLLLHYLGKQSST